MAGSCHGVGGWCSCQGLAVSSSTGPKVLSRFARIISCRYLVGQMSVCFSLVADESDNLLCLRPVVVAASLSHYLL